MDGRETHERPSLSFAFPGRIVLSDPFGMGYERDKGRACNNECAARGGGMDRKWLPLNALRAFEAAGQHLSFTAAANSLTVAQSAVSRHVIVLENFLGVALFERRPQQLVLTEAGRHILPVVSKSFDRIDQALGEVIKEKGRPKRVLKVALPTSFAHRLAIPILRDFRSENAGISLEIVSKPTTGPEVDGDIDIAIVYSEPRVTDAIHDLLWMVRSTLLCSPKLIEGTDASDLGRLIANSDLLHLKIDGRPRHFFWEMFVRSIGRPDLAVDRGLVFDTQQLAAQYAMMGDGLALLDPLLFHEEIKAGRLVRPYDLWLDEGYGYYLTTHPEDLSNEAVALFRSWLIARFAGGAPPPAPEPELPAETSKPQPAASAEPTKLHATAAEPAKLRAAK
jgi:DNA-binding transcriptional LysR family regulator